MERTSEELAKLAAFVLQLDEDEATRGGISFVELLTMARRLAGSVLTQYEVENGEI